MQVAKAHPQLCQDIISRLQHWHNRTRPLQESVDAPMAGKIQDSIGWGIIFKGCLAIRWREEQEQYLKVFKSQKSSSKHWTTALLTRLMATAWDMWQHCNEALHNKQEQDSQRCH